MKLKIKECVKRKTLTPDQGLAILMEYAETHGTGVGVLRGSKTYKWLMRRC